MHNNQTITFVLDGKLRTIDFSIEKHYSPNTTLLNYLRSLPNHKGTKEGCAEGDCGACTIVVASLTSSEQLEYKAINACLVLLPMIHGKQIITIENLDEQGKLHPIQQSYLDHHASQCGFCTPGFIMSSLSLYKSNTQISAPVINDRLAGNLCRCTGYQPIIDATTEVCKKPQADHFTKNEQQIIALLKSISQDSLLIEQAPYSYYRPASLHELLQIRKQHPSAIIISGATDVALQLTNNFEQLPEIIDLAGIVELHEINISKQNISFGAACNLNLVQEHLTAEFQALSNILHVFGSHQIRNLASIGGNIASASPIGDLLPVLISYRAKLQLASTDGTREMLLKDFLIGYRKTAIKANEIILSVGIPVPEKGTIIKSYKISKRVDLDISSVSACFRLRLKNSIIEDIDMNYGGMAASVVQANQTINYLLAKEWNHSSLAKAIELLKSEFNPISDARATAEGRILMAINLFRKFFNETCQL